MDMFDCRLTKKTLGIVFFLLLFFAAKWRQIIWEGSTKKTLGIMTPQVIPEMGFFIAYGVLSLSFYSSCLSCAGRVVSCF